MVKKIRVIDEVPASDNNVASAPDNATIELAKSMDWKLWEILQLLQRLEKKLGNIDILDK
tara:strand:- start:1036 stop:1215 length:180 start_codon:yes stop_codon:yes gene_type:complete